MIEQWGRGGANQQLVFSTLVQQKKNDTVSGFFVYCYLKT